MNSLAAFRLQTSAWCRGRRPAPRPGPAIGPGSAAALALLLSGLLAVPAPARADNDDDDHDRARAAVAAGEVMPLQAVLARLRTRHPGEVLEVELEQDHGRWRYEIKLLQPDGALRKLKLDARTGELLQHPGRRDGPIGASAASAAAGGAR